MRQFPYFEIQKKKKNIVLNNGLRSNFWVYKFGRILSTKLKS